MKSEEIYMLIYMTTAPGIFGFSGFTVNCNFDGLIIQSISSIGMAPSKTVSPKTSAPVRQMRFEKFIFTGPT